MTIGPAQDNDPARAAILKLGRHRSLARLVLVFERLWPRLWPALGVAGLFLCAALLDLLPSLPPWPHIVVLAVSALAFVTLLARAIWKLKWPADRDADRRLEAASGLRHRPLAVLYDKPAFPGAEAIWRAHVARAIGQITRLRVGAPHPGLAAIDRTALRCGLVVALVASVVVAGADAPLRLWRAVTPGFAAGIEPPSSLLQAWITPPGYTGLPPVFLKPELPSVAVPAGSHLTVSVTGSSGEPSLTLGGKAHAFQALDATSFQADQDLTSGGRLAVVRRGRELGAWDVTVVADNAPVVSFPEPPGRARGTNRIPLARLPWQVSHEYGVASLQAELRLKDRPAAAPVVVNVPLPGGSPKSAKGVRTQDLTAHPWAGLPVIAKLIAKDAPGAVGESAPAEFVLPMRRFENPVARAILEVRKELSRAPDQRAPAIVALTEIAGISDTWSHDFGAYANLAAIIGQVRQARDEKAIESAQALMWMLALHLEEGAPEQTARALAEARQALREMTDKQQQGEKLDPKELDKRLKAVEEALQRHLQALAEQAKRDPGAHDFDPEARRLDQRDVKKLADEAREAAKKGENQEAEQKLAELDKLLQDMQNARPEHGKMSERDRQRQQKRQRGEQQMTALQDIVRREGNLLDGAQARDQVARDQSARDLTARDPSRMLSDPRRPFGFPPPRGDFKPPSAQDDPQARDANQQKAAGDRQREQSVQQALRLAVGELMQQFGDLTGEVPANLGDADKAMRDAQQALGQSRDGPAASAEQKAIEALQKGGQSMSMQLAQQFGRSPGQKGEEGDGDDQEGNSDQAGSGQDGEGDNPQFGTGEGRGTRPWDPRGRADRRADERRDPLGRPLKEGTSGTEESGDVQVPEKMEEARSRAIQEELRRRDSDRGRPQYELDYIERLLKQF